MHSVLECCGLQQNTAHFNVMLPLLTLYFSSAILHPAVIFSPSKLSHYVCRLLVHFHFSRSYGCTHCDRLLSRYFCLSVRVRLSVTKCIVAKQYILQLKCLNKWIGNAPKNTILQRSTPVHRQISSTFPPLELVVGAIGRLQ